MDERAWRRCGACGLGHTARDDGRCPRCGATIEARPEVEARSAEAVAIPESLASGAFDPALVRRVAAPPARLRSPALLTAAASLAVAATAAILQAPNGYVGAGVGLFLASGIIALMARA